jgi:peptidoglycan hydrolase-like protein with peptidoglycan-binding domain
MTIGKELAQFATYSVAMATAVAFSLWVWFVPLRIGGFAGPVLKQEFPEQEPRVLLPLAPGDCGLLVARMQGKLIEGGYSVASTGADGYFDDSTLTALGAFQDNNALPVQPMCVQQCWAALGLSQPGSVWGKIEAALNGDIFQSPACRPAHANHRPAAVLP